jgi:DNA polymerase I-like protein with 3'-5' exonuclease and polymerase domains
MLFTLDLETSVDCKDDGRSSGTPHYSGNSIVLAGWKAKGEHHFGTDANAIVIGMADWLYAGEELVLCGFNIGFDLAYLLRDEGFRKLMVDFRDKIRVWDVQQAQYLISGQTLMYPSLDGCCELYGLPVKPDKIKAYWQSGMRTQDIPFDELREYLQHDVSVTDTLAKLQVKKMDNAMRELCFIKGDDILCTTIMENVGMHFDLEICGDVSDSVRSALLDTTEKLHWLVRSETGYEQFQPTKNKEVATVLYGGKFEWDIKVEDGVYKTGLKKGQVKYKKQTQEIVFDGILSPTTKAQAKEVWQDSVSDQVMQWILENEHPENWAVGQFIGYMQNFREMHKDLSTYYDGYAKLVWEDSMIRPSFQHCATRTGRQSCTQPNLQNVSKGE